MIKLWQYVGHVLFWVCWPILFVYLRIGTRTRVLVICGNDILVVKGWLGGNKWSLPGGGVHRGELPIDGAIRELKEETGIHTDTNNLTSFGLATKKENGLTYKYERFRLQLNSKPKLKRQKFEIIDVAWIPMKELNSRNAETTTLDVVGAWNLTSVSDTIK